MLSTNKFFISCKESRIENNRSFYSCFYLGPFDSGQSLTIANALRRTLLSELSGIAITSAEIQGAFHEYSNIRGVKESVLDILLNLKEIVLKKTLNVKKNLKDSKDPLNDIIFVDFGYLKVRGPGVVRAGDLKLPPSVHCVDPEQYIATLCEDGTLNIKFSIHEGKNYIIQKTQKSNLQKNMDSSLDYPELKKRSNALKKLLSSSIKIDNFMDFSGGSNTTLIESKPNPISTNISNLDMNVAGTAGGALLPIDAVFMPVSKVNYILEANDQSNDNYNPGSRQRTTYIQNIQNSHSADQVPLLAETAATVAKTDLIQIKRKKLSMFNKHMLNMIKESYASNVYSTSPSNRSLSSSTRIHGEVTHTFGDHATQLTWSDSRAFSQTADENLLENFTDSIKNLKKSSLTFKKLPLNLEKKEFKISSRSSTTYNGTTIAPLPADVGSRGILSPNQAFGGGVSGSNMKFLALSENLNKKNNIILEIWTNGSMHPRQALYEALKNLLGVFLDLQKAQNFKSIFKSPETYQKAYRQLELKTPRSNSKGGIKSSKNLLSGSRSTPETTHSIWDRLPQGGLRTGDGLTALPQQQRKTKKSNAKQKPHETNSGINEAIESFDIGTLNISLRAYTCLKRANINTIGELINCTENQLLEIKNFGKRCFNEVERSLASLGLQLKTRN